MRAEGKQELTFKEKRGGMLIVMLQSIWYNQVLLHLRIRVRMEQ